MKTLLTLMLTLLITQISATVYLEPTPQFQPKVEIATVYIEYDGLILLLHRQSNKTEGNKWGIPGGKIDKNESPLCAVIREIKEETGFDISNQSIDALKAVFIEHDERNHIVYHAFRTQLQGNPGDVKINFDEHKGFTWVTPADALKMDLMRDEGACIMKDYSIRLDQ